MESYLIGALLLFVGVVSAWGILKAPNVYALIAFTTANILILVLSEVYLKMVPLNLLLSALLAIATFELREKFRIFLLNLKKKKDAKKEAERARENNEQTWRVIGGNSNTTKIAK